MPHDHDHKVCGHADHHVTPRTDAEAFAVLERVAHRLDTDPAFRHAIDEATTTLMKAMPQLAILALVTEETGPSWMMVAGIALLDAEERAHA